MNFKITIGNSFYYDTHKSKKECIESVKTSVLDCGNTMYLHEVKIEVVKEIPKKKHGKADKFFAELFNKCFDVDENGNTFIKVRQ